MWSTMLKQGSTSDSNLAASDCSPKVFFPCWLRRNQHFLTWMPKLSGVDNPARFVWEVQRRAGTFEWAGKDANTVNNLSFSIHYPAPCHSNWPLEGSLNGDAYLRSSVERWNLVLRVKCWKIKMWEMGEQECVKVQQWQGAQCVARSRLNMYWKQGEVCARNAVKPMCLMCA